jgi:DNA repair exonuclease SbcCD ATPase subunit
MSMTPRGIIVEGFGSFRERSHFHFPQEPGLYFMRGENRDEPRLGANGAGKSTIWKALSWVFWDKTAEGLRADGISSWGGKKGTTVIFEFHGEVNGISDHYFLKRTRKPNSWTLSRLFDAGPIDLTKDATNPVLAELRLQYESFLHSIYMAQRAELFLDMKPEPKAQLFSSMMGLDRWLDFSTRASAAASAQDKVSRRLESERAQLSGRLEESGTKDLEASADDFERKRSETLAGIEQEYLQATRRSKAAKQRSREAVEKEEGLQGKVEALVNQRNGVFGKHQSAYKKLREKEDALLVLQRDYDHAVEHWESLKSNKGCPKCGRPFDRKGQEALTQKVEDEMVKVGRLVNQARDHAHELGQEFQALDDRLQELDASIKWAIDDRDVASGEARNARRDHELEERRLDQLEEESERVEKELNPFSGMLKGKQDDLARLKREYEGVSARLEQSYERFALQSLWVRGFKEVRLQLISEALDELEVEVNNELVELGLVGWELRFDVDAETKKGTFSRGFSVSVLSPGNPERVPWESWSGGEAQRLRLAAQCGLSNLIRSRTGCDFPLEVWDEPTEGLSEEGITDLLTALNERAIREQRIIWVVDHRALGYGGFAGTATIVKDAKGSRVVQATV